MKTFLCTVFLLNLLQLVVNEAPDCPDNSTYNNCASSCPITCENMFLNEGCNKRCDPRCVCNEGYVLNDSKCIRKQECDPSIIKCPPNSNFTKCGTACPRNCTNMYLPKPCILICKLGCECNEGYVLDAYGNCIPAIKCDPSECEKDDVNSEFSECHPPCDPNCNDPNPNSCKLESCRRGCRCKKGYVRDGYNRCIPLEKCPKY